MSTTCSHCNATNPDTAHFCQNCGRTMAAASAPGKTMVYSTSTGSAQPPPPDVGSIVTPPQTTAYGTLAAAPRARLIRSQREHTALVLDISGSMAWDFDGNVNKLEAAMRAAANLVTNKARLDPDDCVGLIPFDDDAEIVFGIQPLRLHRIDLIRSIHSLAIGGGTDLDKGLLKAEEALEGYLESATCHLGDFMEYQGLRRELSDLESAGSKSRRAERRSAVTRRPLG